MGEQAEHTNDITSYQQGSAGVEAISEQERRARRACFNDCASGAHLDFEAGCVSVCRSEAECTGWIPYLKTR